MSVERAWQNAKNILCVRLDSLGDILMTSPAIRALKEGKPERKITLLTSASGAAIAP
jgi:ADP-heptose:LPS heptosyltransferase